MLQLNVLRDHFTANPPDPRGLFRQSVRRVEIETFTYCNRKCWFCGNKDLPERQSRSANQTMDARIYTRIIADLASISYAGEITFSRYNEPLARPDILLPRLKEARALLPSAVLLAHTNGDYLTAELLARLSAAGLNQLNVQTYGRANERQSWHYARMKQLQDEQIDRLGLNPYGSDVRTLLDSYEYRVMRQAWVSGVMVCWDARNWDKLGNSRGDTVPLNIEHRRTAPCFEPFTGIWIDWNGSVFPCCNLRSDAPEHQKYVVGVLQPDGQPSIFDVWAAMHEWRRSLFSVGAKSAPCHNCTYEEIQNPGMDSYIYRTRSSLGLPEVETP